MTPAINQAKKAKIPYTVHEYDHDPSAPSYGEEAAERLGLEPEQVFKTLVADCGGELVVAVVPVSGMLDLKALARLTGAKKAAMAEVKLVEKTTGYVVGGVSPLGQKKRLKTVIDESAQGFGTIHVSAGRRGLEIELAPGDLAKLTGGVFGAVAR